MLGIKVALGVVGVFIIAGFVFVGMEVYRRATDVAYRESLENPPAQGVLAKALTLPAGSRIESMIAVGNRLSFLVRTDGAGDRLYVFDPFRNQITAEIATASAGPAPADAAGNP